MTKKKKFFIIFGAAVFLISVFIFYLLLKTPVKKIANFGVNFSYVFSEELGVDPKEVYLNIFDDLKIKDVRIVLYWDKIESEKGKYDFSFIDWLISEAEKRDAKLILAVGRKTPRWPECHEPSWYFSLPVLERNNILKNFIKEVILRYDKNPAVFAWQIENEPYLSFGVCPEYDKNFVGEEISFAKSLTKKPIVVTDGGEFGDWFRAYKHADIFGSTLYRYVNTKIIGEWTYPIPAAYFRARQSLMKLFYGEKLAVVIEFQAEPWGKKNFKEMTVEEQYALFGSERFNEIMKYAGKTGFDTFYFWGAEWWYWLANQGHNEMLEAVKREINKI